ncbi:hypothetical protein [Micromonospora sp. NBC_01813]|uniref:hypothetical protein n=1 Tax=Micromonospora sp. NBC_01813 TaxID=2975988 RepID=UPI002DDA4B3D|nr:hypothetical protein [Micromonospora sp. NBC_01813]WSA10905.1 hypothetical protein OG958_09080 [Micromonospora sp. NBC_01813]
MTDVRSESRQTWAQVRGIRSALLVGALAAVLVGGCAGPFTGVDRDLTGDWPSFDEPVQFVPEASTCHTKEMTIGLREEYAPFDCLQWHSSAVPGRPGVSD